MVTHSELLQQNPDVIADNGHGGNHIPIADLENSLDAFHWSSQNYQWNLYKDGYANLCVAASIEVVLNYITDNSEKMKRTFVGACNFPLSSLMPIPDWNATAKSMCIKNAASDAGRWLGRGINEERLPDRTPIEKKVVKMKPDSKIMKQFAKAIEDKDEATITMLSNIYDINIPANVEEK